jgi:hypothetical protein
MLAARKLAVNVEPQRGMRPRQEGMLPRPRGAEKISVMPYLSPNV